MRTKRGIGVVVVVLATAIAGCGGSKSSSGGTSSSKPSTASKAEVNKLLEQTFGANPKASSGMLDGRIDIHVKGVKAYRKPVALTMTGPFNDAGGQPEANLSVGIELHDTALGGELILKDGRTLIGVGSTGYQVPDSISKPLRRPIEGSPDNTLGAILNVFGIEPRRWATNPRIVGNETLAGVPTIHGTAGIDTKRFFLDVAKLAKRLTSLRITDITNLPRAVDRKARAALVRSVKSATGDVYTGAKDHVMRKAKIDIVIKPSARDRKVLGGISSMTIAGDLNVTEVGTNPKVERPTSTGSYADLQIVLDALGESARRQFR